MYSIDGIAKEIYDSVVNNRFMHQHKNIVVVGDNESGKTTLLKKLLSMVKEGDGFYFIDSLNRVVSGSAIKNQDTDIRYDDFPPEKILNERKSQSFFSKEDIFIDGVQGSLATYSELSGNIEEYERLFNNFFECKISWSDSLGAESVINGSKTLQINGNDINSLSSSLAAKIRLIMEIEYAKRSGCKFVIIDEFDDHFEAGNMVSFIEQLQRNYMDLRFLIVIHNFDVLVQIFGFDAVIYNNPNTTHIEILVKDCDDVTAIGQVERIRAKYLGSKDEKEDFLSDCISSWVKTGTISDEQDKLLLEIDRKALNLKNKILFDYILEHKR